MNMKKVVVLMCVVSMSAGASASSFMGPPTAELEQGQWKAGYIFSYSELDIEGTETSLADEKYTFKPGEITRHYFDLGYGLAENLELNLLLGVASVDLGDFEYDDGDVSPGDFTGSDDCSYGFNAKCTFVDDETIDWGAMLQMTWFSGDGKWEGNDEEFDAYDLQIAVGPTIDMGGWDLYGGGYFYMLDGDLKAIGIWKDDLEEEDKYGGYVGAACKIMKNTDLTIECIFSRDTLGIGANIGWRF
jgi:hypothetical protein